MSVEFSCRDVGIECNNVAKAESAEELVPLVADHARTKHHVELNETLIDYAVTKVRSTGV